MIANVPQKDCLEIYPDSAAFLRRCSSFLCAREAENNLILGIAGVLGTCSSPYQTFYLASAGVGNIEGAFMMTPPHHLVISSPASESAMKAVIQDLTGRNIQVTGVNGKAEISDRYVQLWSARAAVTAQLSTDLLCYQLAAVKWTPKSTGRMRKASLEDFDSMVKWAEGFDHDVHFDHHPDQTKQNIRNGIAGGQLYVWEDGVPGSMARATGATPTGIRISHVYTPPEKRGHGFASALVAGVSQLYLDSGRKFCFLFTNAKNPTSNRIYQKIGYEQICSFHDYSFVAADKR